MIELLQQLIQALVSHPDDVRLTEINGERSLIVELRCHPSDLGKVIGKNGKTISAVRTVMNAIAARQGRRAMIEVVE